MVRTIRWSLLALLVLGPGCSREPVRDDPEIPVRVRMVALGPENTPVLILEETNGPRVLPIWIGSAEAGSIASQINEQPPPRPNFHDLAKRLIEGLEANVESVVVTELRHATYYALLTLTAHGRRIEIDVRPSDGIAVALRTRAPIRVRASVFDEAGERLVGEGDETSIRWSPRGGRPATPALEL